MVICIIPAKNESKRLPGKNMILCNGKPMIDYAIEKARASKLITDIYISTDSNAIADYALRKGIKVIQRDSSLGGETEIIDVYIHAINNTKTHNISYVVGLQADHPDRQIDLDEVIRYAMDNNYDDVISIDRNGKRNGSVRVMKADSLINNRLSRRLGVVKDDCINIHNKKDLLLACHRLKPFLEIKVLNKLISKTAPVFIIAEAANNHMCDIEMAKVMIDKASEAGADAIKFQTYKAERLVVRTAVSYWNYGGAAKSQYDYYKNLDKFGQKEYRLLFDYAKKKNIIAFSTPFDVESARVLQEVDVPLFKIPSACIPDKRLLRYVASLNKPIILSTGGSSVEEIEDAVTQILDAGNNQLILLACTMSYPTKNADANILRVKTLSERFPDFIIGLSDHTEPDAQMAIPSLGVALGAKVIEKHFTLDRTMMGSGHSFSVEPKDLKKMVENIRLAQIVLGSGELNFTEAEKSSREGARGSLVANRDIKKGEKITDDLIAVKRPGTGLSASLIDKVIGRVSKTDIKEDSQITFEQLI